MPLQPATTLGAYSVTAKIGEGGIGADTSTAGVRGDYCAAVTDAITIVSPVTSPVIVAIMPANFLSSGDWSTHQSHVTGHIVAGALGREPTSECVHHGLLGNRHGCAAFKTE